MNILIINAGSSSIKFRLVNQYTLALVAKGQLEGIATKKTQLSYCLYKDQRMIDQLKQATEINNATEGFNILLELLKNRIFIKQPMELVAIGHRVVHGGEQFMQSVLISEAVMDAIGKNIALAPEHNPANLKGIEVCRAAFPMIPQVAVFDTAFHQTIPAKAYRYPLAETLYTEHKIRRYGFHGNSHHYVADCMAQAFDAPIAQLDFITLHLGNGASATAIQGGISIDTSMGMTPLEGLMMGTRSGNIDPGIIFYLARNTQLDFAEIETLLNKQSGLSGICGSNDMREIQQRADQGDKQAILAIDMYCYRIKKYIGAYYAILGGLDGLVFTAGIGENSSVIRMQVCQGLENLGICIDPEKNRAVIKTATEIQVDNSPVKIFVIPTDEEIEIARQVCFCIGSKIDLT